MRGIDLYIAVQIWMFILSNMVYNNISKNNVNKC